MKTVDVIRPGSLRTIIGPSGTLEEFYKLKYCSTVVYMVPRA